jgi:hypothetical protein
VEVPIQYGHDRGAADLHARPSRQRGARRRTVPRSHDVALAEELHASTPHDLDPSEQDALDDHQAEITALEPHQRRPQLAHLEPLRPHDDLAPEPFGACGFDTREQVGLVLERAEELRGAGESHW